MHNNLQSTGEYKDEIFYQNIKSRDVDHLKIRVIQHPPEVKIGNHYYVLFVSGTVGCLYQQRSYNLSSAKLWEVLYWTLGIWWWDYGQNMKLCLDLKMYTECASKGETIAMEILLDNWLPIWKTCQETNYVNLPMTNMETLYHDMACAGLEIMRINIMMHQIENGGMIAIDKACEILNDQLKINASVNVDTLLHKSLFV